MSARRGVLMRSQDVNRVSAAALMILALVALGTVLSGYLFPPMPTGDEGAQARLFQFAVALMAPVGLVFLGSTDWAQPGRAFFFG